MTAAGSLWFVDTNLLLYALDSKAPAKQHLASTWLDSLWKHEAGRLSWQVLHEFYVNATGKLGAPAATSRRIVESYAEWQPIGFNIALIRRAWYWTDHADLNYWDALILAAAELCGCSCLLSEDFQTGRKYGVVQIMNPFQTEPARFFSK